MGGKPCIRGMRITVGTIIGLLASGKTPEEILSLYDFLEAEDIREALGYAAWCTANPNNDHSFYEYQEETQSAAKVYYIHLFKSNIRKAKFAKFAVEVLKDGGVLIFDRDDASYGSRKFLNELAEGQDLYNVTPKEMEELIDKIYTFAETDRYVNPKAKLSENKRRPYRLKIRYN